MNDVPLEITCGKLQKQLDTEEPTTLIDCREPDEYAIVALPEAKLVPMAAIPSRLGELVEIDGTVVVYCHHGMRSAQAVQWLRTNGLPEAQSLAGGIDAWAAEIDPALPRY